MEKDPEARMTADDFRFAFRNHPAGVAVITADIGDGPVSMTVSSLASVTIDPPALVFSASTSSHSAAVVAQAETVVIHLLAADHADLAKLASTSGIDRFGPDIVWSRLPTGEPYYPQANVWMRGRVRHRFPVDGGATLIVVEAIEAKPVNGEDSAGASPLVYHNRTWHAIGDHSVLKERS